MSQSTNHTNGLQDFIAVSRYSRYRADLGRREVWSEAVERVRDMHLKFFAGKGPELAAEIVTAFDLVKERKILPSMRSIQFGGEAILQKHGRIFNCSFSFADRPRFFSEAFYMLLCGTGVGFSVQKHHVNKLDLCRRTFHPDRVSPEFPWQETHVIADTIEGWADAVDRLIWSYLNDGTNVVRFDYSLIRPAGSPLKVGGGKAPGPEPLRTALEKIREVLDSRPDMYLRPIDVYDIVMHMSQAVLSGGVRRSATICLFSSDDEDMRNAKTGDWFNTHPQRAFSNNSAILERDVASKEEFMALFEAQKQFGEPGFYFTANRDYGANPCVEIGLNPQITEDIWSDDGYSSYPRTSSGWQMCNLTTINGAVPKNTTEFLTLCKYATLIGTLQAAYTNIEYCGPVTKAINDREALLGVSICGIMDNPELLLSEDVLRAGAAHVKGMNAYYARMIGINPAARTTCVKPEGTASLLLGVASGIHPHHAKRYFRRVQNNKLDPVYQHFKAANAHMCEPSVYDQGGRTDVVTFPIEAPAGAKIRKEMPALELLKAVKLVQQHWVREGTAYDHYSPGLEHNVSNTINVAPHEWDEVAEFIWQNRADFTGIALLQEMGDKAYPQAPREEVANHLDETIFEMLRVNQRTVDYTAMRESHDATELKQEPACAGGACELPPR
jgi:ribonucleoside-triphosphate reductase